MVLRSYLGLALHLGLVLIAFAGASKGVEITPFQKALSFIQQQRYDEAIVYLDISVSEKRDVVQALEQLACCHVMLRNYAQARKALEGLALAAPPQKPSATLEAQLIETYASTLPKLETEALPAVATLRQVAGRKVARTPIRAQAALSLADFYYKENKFPDASAFFEQVRSDDSGRLYKPDVAVRHLRSLLSSEEYIQTIDLYPKLARALSDPHLSEAQDVFADSVLRHAQKAANLDRPTRGTLRMGHDVFRRGLAALPAGSPSWQKLDKALADFERVMGHALKAQGVQAVARKDTPMANHCVADILEIAARCDGEARSWAEDLKREMEDAAHRMYVDGVKLLIKKEYPEAIEKLKVVPVLYPRTDGAWNALWYMAQAYDETDQPEKAFLCHQKAFEEYPGSPGFCNVCYKLGQYYERKQRMDHAARVYRMGVEKAPKTINADMCQFLLALIYWERKDYTRCYEEADRFLKLFPQSALKPRLTTMLQFIETHQLKSVSSAGVPQTGSAQEKKGK